MGFIAFLFFYFGTAVGNYGQTVHEIHQEQGVPTASVRVDGRLTLYKRDKYERVSFKEVFSRMADDQRYWNELCSQFNERGNYRYVECARRRGAYIPAEDVVAWNIAMGNEVRP